MDVEKEQWSEYDSIEVVEIDNKEHNKWNRLALQAMISD